MFMKMLYVEIWLMIFLNMLSELNRFQFVKQLFVVHTYNEHRILPPKSGVWRQNGRDHSGHARFMSFLAGCCLPQSSFLAEGAPKDRPFLYGVRPYSSSKAPV